MAEEIRPLDVTCNLANWSLSDVSVDAVDQDTAFSQYQWLSRVLGLALLPVIFTLGLCGNSLALVVLQGDTYSRLSTGFLLTCLAVCDTLSLLTGLLRKWISLLTSGRLDVRLYGNFGCVIHYFLTYASQAMGSWTLVVLTLERVVAVYFPVQTRRWLSKDRARRVWLLVFTVVTGFYSHLLFVVDINHLLQNETQPICHIKLRYRKWDYDVIFARVDLALMATAPCCVIIVSNLMIISRLCQAKRERARALLTTSRLSSGVYGDRKHVTVMLILVSAVFLLLTIPYALHYALYYILFDINSPEQRGWHHLIETCITLLYYTNNAVNFPLYCLSAAGFRSEFASLICRVRVMPALRPPCSSARASIDLQRFLVLSGSERTREDTELDRRPSLSALYYGEQSVD